MYDILFAGIELKLFGGAFISKKKQHKKQTLNPEVTGEIFFDDNLLLWGQGKRNIAYSLAKLINTVYKE